ncbi:MAG TPA: hypothetical protein VEC76_16100 [Streptosporangiaceae bacterium]|nr:hypothetical protein [Streptosporangiaceae bacterium]
MRPFDASPAAIGVSLAIVAGTALLGLAAGFIWSAVAPRAALVMVSHGAAGLVQAETTAFIAADAAFALIALTGGVVSGALGYLVGVRRYGPLAMIGVLAGAVAAAYAARWAGQQPGLARFHHLLATLPVGAHLNDSLMLQTTGALAFWPLAAGLVAGGLEAFVTRDRGRRRTAGSQPALAGPGPGPGGPWPPGVPGGLQGVPDGQQDRQQGPLGRQPGNRLGTSDGQHGGQPGTPAGQPRSQPGSPGGQGQRGHE